MPSKDPTRSIPVLMSALTLLLPLAGAAERQPSATPDISGPWEFHGDASALRTVDGAPPPLLPGMKTAYLKNRAAFKAGDHSADPAAKCLPPGVPRLMMQSMPFNIVQGSTMYGFMFQWNHLSRVIYLNQRHFEPIGPLYLGQSIGHWEGDTLVIDTNNYNDMTLLDDAGLPHTDALHTVEHVRLIDGGKRLEDRIRFEDPGAFSKPWESVLRFDRQPTALIEEDYCLGRVGHSALAQK